MTDDGLEELISLPYLRSVDVSMCVKVTDRGVGHLCKINTLKYIDVHGCAGVTKTWPSLHPYITFKFHSLNR